MTIDAGFHGPLIGWPVHPERPMPRVTMVVSAYRRPRQILVTLHSLLCQDHPDTEIIVVHDGPGAEVRAAIGKLPVRYEELAERQGDWGNTAKEVGSSLATGEWIGHANDDNYYCPVYLSMLLDHAIPAGAEFVFSDFIHSHQGWRPFHARPHAGGMDGTGWLCRADIVRATPWPEPRQHQMADGHYIERLAAGRRLMHVDHCLWVHN